MDHWKRFSLVLMAAFVSVLPPAPSFASTYCFLSFSVPRETLKTILTSVTKDDDCIFVFRGFAGDTFKGMSTAMKKLGLPRTTVAKIIIDPTKFEDYGIVSVPAYVQEKDGKPYILRGEVGYRFFQDRLQNALESNLEGVDLGTWGQLREIAEKDFLQVILSKVQEIDWKGKAAQAQRNYYRHFEVSIPVARENRTYLVDPSVLIEEDVKDTNGNIIVPRGTKKNPLEVVSVSGRMIVFDGTDATQIEAVRNRIKPEPQDLLVTSRGDPLEVMKRLNRFVYLLSPQVRSRFEIEHVPCVIRATPPYMEVQEIKPERLFSLREAFVADAHAEESSTSTGMDFDEVTCPDAFPDLFTDVCWKAVFPIKLGPVTIFSGDFGDNESEPDNIFCCCHGTSECNEAEYLDIQNWGLWWDWWSPDRIIEIVRKPFCLPFFWGAQFSVADAPDVGIAGNMHIGSSNRVQSHADGNTLSSVNVHYYAFPLFEILQLLLVAECEAGGFFDLDLLYMTEFDPTWNREDWGLVMSPEAALFANSIAQVACSADCVLSSANSWGTDWLFWCAGCWGGIYPFTGHVPMASDPLTVAGMAATKLLGKLHRTCLAWTTVGSDAKCGPYVWPMLTKSQYRLSLLYPVAMRSGRCAFPIGRSSFEWGQGKLIPGVGEDFIFMLWVNHECCIR